ncbi:formate dehydrogenase subunit gamma [Methylopila musalis]|uniref:Formate dehydrogenase subunit gamma n=1 Tax=Methylopila musalis TaxID=1134781 RepID=A0ABW3Z3L1_9HYPH
MAIEIERRPMIVERTEVKRYSASARVNHWITAICFVLLTLSGLALFHPSLFFLTDLFGGGANTRAFHPWIGVVLVASFSVLFVRFWKLNLWNRDDTRWMSQIGDVVKGEEEHLPELGKYNAGQKMVFWGTSLLLVVLLASGLVIWDQYFHGLVSINVNRLAALTHSLAAIGAILIIIVHIYAGIWVKGTVRAMTQGQVTGGWAWRHHRKWLRSKVKETDDH